MALDCVFADNNEISGIFVFETEFNPSVTVLPTSYIWFHLSNTGEKKTQKKQTKMQLNFLKTSVLWKRQCQELAVVFLEHDDVQIPGAA